MNYLAIYIGIAIVIYLMFASWRRDVCRLVVARHGYESYESLVLILVYSLAFVMALVWPVTILVGIYWRFKKRP